jgi:hypothetical protein
MNVLPFERLFGVFDFCPLSEKLGGFEELTDSIKYNSLNQLLLQNKGQERVISGNELYEWSYIITVVMG